MGKMTSAEAEGALLKRESLFPGIVFLFAACL